MPYVLSVAMVEHEDRHFPAISDALAFYERARLENARLRFTEKQTFVDLFPGITTEVVERELASVWEWAADDPLQVRPRLKRRYLVKT
ncbi:hypothetical protein [Pseudomonas xantholysinigenes]|uniref:Uncharacterized protein n=1 Tax=Pseudomonas xantholysinigenes TaxID=2745490 RepID=A0A9E6PXX0_9PSED|nr:hypothetical protein [Pseudomonas xantholysinigenes]QXI38907.1 hypothetical protein HU772_002075 [Pseudomonas xantholysinigenes]